MKTIITLLLAGCTATLWSQSASRFSGDDLLGHWYMQRMTIEIYKDDAGKYFGKIVHLENQDNFRRLTPNSALIFRRFEYTANGEWTRGKVYVEQFGREFDAHIEMVSINNIRTSAGSGVLSRTLTWKRVHNFTAR